MLAFSFELLANTAVCPAHCFIYCLDFQIDRLLELHEEYYQKVLLTDRDIEAERKVGAVSSPTSTYRAITLSPISSIHWRTVLSILPQFVLLFFSPLTHLASPSLLQRLGKSLAAEREDEFYLQRLDSGLFTLQNVDIILAEVIVNGESGVSSASQKVAVSVLGF